MKTIKELHEPTVDGYFERQVMLCPATWEEPTPGAMEDLKISIVNDRAAGVKRQLDKELPLTPCAKRQRRAVVGCSTPCTSSGPLCSSPSSSEDECFSKSNVNTPSHSLQEDAEPGDECDDSLLELSDNESDSSIYLTVDEIESLLEDESCFAAEPQVLEDKASNAVSPPSDKCQKVSLSPSDHLYKSSNEETDYEEDVNNYATMAPSPRHSAEHTLAYVKLKPKNISTGHSVQEKVHEHSTSEILGETHTCQPEMVSSANVPLPLSPSLCMVDVSVKWSESPELPFDYDIDNLLSTNLGGGKSPESEYGDPNTNILSAEQITSTVSDLVTSLEDSKSVKVSQTIHTACSDVKDVVQQPPVTTNSSEPSLASDDTEKGQDVKPSASSSLTTIPCVNPSAKPESQNQQKIAASGGNQVSSASSSGNSIPAVTPLRKLAPRPFISTFELESNKDIYCDHVLMHIEGPDSANNMEDPLQELALLLNKISRANQNWQHPSDFSKRNHPRNGKKREKRCTLKEWVAENGGDVQRFKDLPSTFTRSPVPKDLPSSSS